MESTHFPVVDNDVSVVVVEGVDVGVGVDVVVVEYDMRKIDAS